MSEHNPWRTTDSRLIYKNPWITVREDQVIRPDGTSGIYGVVETKIAVGVAAVTPAHELYLVGQFRYPHQCYSWELIEGGVEHGENPLAGIQRELQEEAGLRANRWSPLGSEIHLSNCISSEIALLYLAQDLTPVPNNPDATEVLTVRKVPFQVALKMVQQGEIRDAMSIIGIHRLEQLIRSGELNE